MTDTQKQARNKQIKEMLLTKKARIEETLKQRTKSHLQSEQANNDVMDDMDLATKTNDDHFTFMLNAQAKQQIQAIQTALMMLEEGNYGSCTECGEDIPIKRLEAKIEAHRCIECQQAHEEELSNEKKLQCMAS